MQTGEPLITIIIPTYRRPHLLGRTIRSALNQTYPHLRVWVLDDASGDETPDVVAELAREDPRVIYHCHSQNIGSVPNFVYGMTHVQTPYFSLLPDDDVLLPQFCRITLNGFSGHPDAMFSAGLVVQMSDTGQVLGSSTATWQRDGYFAPPEALLEMIGGNHPILVGMLFRREVVEAYDLFDPTFVAWDADLEFRIAAHSPFVVTNVPCALFVPHASSASVEGQLAICGHDWPTIARKLASDDSLASETRHRLEEALLAYAQNELYHLGVRLAARGQYQEARKAATLLREDYQLTDKARTIERMANVSERLGFAQSALTLAYRLQRMRHRKKDSALQQQYGSLAGYLKE